MAAMSVQKCLFSLATLLGMLVLDCPAPVSAEPKVVKMAMSRSGNVNQKLVRRNHVNVVVTNDVYDGLYFVNATVGTPPQPVQLQIDTGSSDIWFFGPNSCDATSSMCLGGGFDPSMSSTVDIIGQDDFQIQYGTPGSFVAGDYVTDVFNIGGVSIKNLTMAVASQAEAVPTGIFGIGFDLDESITEDGSKPYPNIIDMMVQQGMMNTRAYSLWLDDLQANTGSVLFGGYDTAKFTGKLLTLDIQPDAQTGTISTMTVAWTGLSVTDSNAGTQTITSSNFVEAALLDSGTTITLVPTDVYEELAQYFDVLDDPDYGPVVKCDLLNSATGTMNFAFGGNGGPVIKVPFSEFALPATDEYGSPLTFQNGESACVFGIMEQDQPDLGVIFGDTFLRSAYVVYDLDNTQISLAQTVFNATDSNVVEIKSGSGIGSLVTGVSVTQSATGIDVPGYEPTATGLQSLPLTPSATPTSAHNTISPLVAGGSAATATASSTQHNDGSQVAPGMFVSVAVSMLALVGGAFGAFL